MRHRPDVSALAGVPLFAPYRARELAPLARHADRLPVAPGTVLARQGARAREVVVILAGDAALVRDGTEIGRLGPGSVVGACEELAGDTHAASVVAGGGTSVLVLPGPAFRWAVRSLPGLALPGAPAA